MMPDDTGHRAVINTVAINAPQAARQVADYLNAPLSAVSSVRRPTLRERIEDIKNGGATEAEALEHIAAGTRLYGCLFFNNRATPADRAKIRRIKSIINTVYNAI